MSRRKKLVAVCGWRWEPQWLVEEFVTNVSQVVDDVHIIDNRHQVGPWQDEGAYRRQQRDIARRMGGDWFWLTSPDERVEDGAAPIIRDAVERGPQAVRMVRLVEMWTPDQYRVDGQFKYRPRARLFPVDAMFGRVKHKRIHSRAINNAARRQRKLYPHLDVRIYHLKNVLEGNRERRVALMKQLDAEIGKRREASWDEFLAEDVALEALPDGRGFTPPYTRPFVWDPKEQR